MILLLALVALALAVLCADDAWSNVVSFRRNHIVFTGRNQDYGAFAIRREYPRNMVLAIFISLGLMAGGLLLATSGVERTVIIPTEISTLVNLPPIGKTKDADKPKDKPTNSRPKAASSASASNAPPEVVDNRPQTTPDPLPAGTGGDQEGELPWGPSGEGGTGQDDVTAAPKPDTTHAGTWADKMPQFYGGDKALFEYIYKNLRFPHREQELGKEGTVWITFVVEPSGKVGRVGVERGVKDAPGLEKEALKPFQNMPAWQPGEMNGVPVPVRMRIPIRFTLKED